MIGLAATLEAWLLPRREGPRTYRLARHASWFGCGSHNGDLCGRSRPICPYLHLSPDRDGKRLKRLRRLGIEFPGWQCSEWHQVMDWYEARSDAAHANPDAIDAREVEQAEYWIAHYLAEPILEWLGDHRDDPIGDLDAELNRVEQPANWAAILDAIDSNDPPDLPPFGH